MSDIPLNAPLRTDGPHTGIPVYDAAHLLGISENAVRARLRRGTLVGVKHDTSWYVLLRDTDVPNAASAAVGDIPRDAPPHVPSHTAVHDLAPLVSHIATLQDQVQRLTESNTMWQIRARQAEEQLKRLTAGNVAPENAPEAVESSQTNETEPQGLGRR